MTGTSGGLHSLFKSFLQKAAIMRGQSVGQRGFEKPVEALPHRCAQGFGNVEKARALRRPHTVPVHFKTSRGMWRQSNASKFMPRARPRSKVRIGMRARISINFVSFE